MAPILILIAIAMTLGGFLFVSEATLGVGIIAAAGVMAILARIAQSQIQHREVLAAMEKKKEVTE